MNRGEYRAPVLYSRKWTTMRTIISNFNNIANRLSNNRVRASGSIDVDVMTIAHNENRIHHGFGFTIGFTMITCPKLFRKSPKWPFCTII
ncbi:hypothetical protein Hanom_Chr15g01374921 [Helianthus anomalus]